MEKNRIEYPEIDDNNGIVDSFGVEFGFELIMIVPYAYWLHKQGLLKKTISCKDTSCFYWFSPDHTELYDSRFWLPEVYSFYLKQFPLQTIFRPDLDKSKWIRPPYKELYKNNQFLYEKPLFIVANKLVNEFNKHPINYYPPPILRNIFKHLRKNYQIVYSRLSSLQKKYYADDVMNYYYDFQDKEMIENEFKDDVILIEDLYENSGIKSFNTFQCMLYSNCDYYLSVQGGNSVLASFFSKINYIYTVSGDELKHNSYGWFNEFNNSKIKVFNNWDKVMNSVKNNF